MRCVRRPTGCCWSTPGAESWLGIGCCIEALAYANQVGPLGEIFNPGMRHEIEERRSKALRREEEGNARDGDLRIDLDSGFVRITAPAKAAKPAADAEPASDDDAEVSAADKS